MNKIAIFDLDGTLVDSIDDLVLSANEARKVFKLSPLSKEVISSFVGDGLSLFVQRLFDGTGVGIEKAINVFKEKYLLHLTDNTKFYDGIIDCVKKLKANEFTVGILSNKTEKLSRLVVKNLGQEKLFEFVFGGNSFPEKKPSPYPVIQILKMFNGDINNCFIIGDSCNDILSGQKAGIKTIGVTYGFNGTLHLKNCNPDFIAATPDKVCNYMV